MRRTLERPEKITPDGDDGYFEQLTKAVFRAGFSWAVIREKWEGFLKSFENFDLGRVAAYGPDDLERLFEDSRIVRNRRKIIATVENARTMLDFIDDHGSFHAYLRSLDHLDYHTRVKVLTRPFVGLGRTSAFVFLHCVNEETPDWQDR
ncbi:MAG: DNA-3-methyladenine glycosylase I [Dehalococcoidia bacterium]|nr:DNA-3-methyladenine glycosylase I [Dehalococcoidia bacterium]